MSKYFTQEDDLIKIINEEFEQIENVEQVKEGWTNYVFDVKSGGKEFIVRFPRNDFFANALIEEVEFYDFIGDKVDFVTPKANLRWFNGMPFAYHEKIEGKSLEVVYPNLTFEEKWEIARELAKALYELSCVKNFGGKEFETVSSFLDRLSTIGQKDYDLGVHNIFKSVESEGVVLSHGDLNPSNIIIKDKKFYGIIDFAFAGLSAKYMDLARLISRTEGEFSVMLIGGIEDVYKDKINFEELCRMVDAWHYVDSKYIEYMNS